MPITYNRPIRINTRGIKKHHKNTNEVYKNVGWKNALLQFQTQFVFAVYIGILVSYCIVVCEAGLALAVMQHEKPLDTYLTDTKGIIYSFDGFYVLDVVFMIIYKNMESVDFVDSYEPRNAVILVVEVLTLIPSDAVYYIMANFKKPSTVALLRLRYVFRMVRLFYDYRRPSPMTKEQSIFVEAKKVFVTILLVSITLAVIVHPHYCRLQCFPHNVTNHFYSYLYVAVGELTQTGFGKSFHHNKIYENEMVNHIFELARFLALFVMGYIVSKVICTYISNDAHIYSYLIKYTSIKSKLDEWKAHNLETWKLYEECLYNTIENYFQMIWEKRRWYITRAFQEEVLPLVMFRDLYLDISWTAFKHSHIFKNQSVYFLREIAARMSHTVFAPGEVIYNRERLKSEMVYIRSGIIQILSEENSETPIISFSGGTCLGESSLAISYNCNWTVVCKTYCEVTILKRKNFITVSRIYPREYHNLMKMIHKRYIKAKKWKRLAEYQLEQHLVDNPDVVTIAWIKMMLRNILKLESDAGNQNIKKCTKLTFCPKYLDLLVITENIELERDEIFLRKQFPFIFQPKSIFLDAWNCFIGIAAMLVVLGYPVYMLHCNSLVYGTHVFALSVVTFIWCADVYIQASTAVHTKDTLRATISSIIYYRMTNTTFLLDAFSALPYSVLYSMVTGEITCEALQLSECLKLLKIHKLRFIFEKLEMLRLRNRVILKYVKVFLCDLFLFYYTAIIIYYIIWNSKEHWLSYIVNELKLSQSPNPWQIMLHLITMATLFSGDMSSVDLMKYIPYNSIVIIIVLQLLYTFYSIYVKAYISIVETLRERKIYEYMEFASSMGMVAKDMNISPILRKRVILYLKDHFHVDKGLTVLQPSLFKGNMSRNLHSTTNQVLYGKFLQDLPLFTETDQHLIIEASRNLKITHYPPGEVITYAGEVCKDMHIIEFGFCKIINEDHKILRPSDGFCVIETCMQIPTFYTIVTLTDCKVLSVSYVEYARLATRHPDFKASIDKALQESIFRSDVHSIQEKYPEPNCYLFKAEEKAPLTRRFQINTADSRRRYYQYFPTYMCCLKYLLMHQTFPSYGTFLFYWEICRIIFAFATIIVVSYTFSVEKSNAFYAIFFFDITAWTDLYVRHHVCYFNKDGIEVSHPAKTAQHYWQNGLLVDFLGCVPIDYLSSNAARHPYLRINRLLQLHRAFGFIRYILNRTLSKRKVNDIILCLPLMIIGIIFLSSVGIYTTCESLSNTSRANHICGVEKWAQVYLNKSDVLPMIKRYVSSLLITTTSITLTNFHRIDTTSVQELGNAILMVICGHLLFIWLTARLVSYGFYRKTDLTAYQEAMKHLLTFVSARKIDKNIKNEIITYYEHMWKKTRAKNVVLLLNSFSTAIKEDVLYDIFGKNISLSRIFPPAPKSFFKSLLLESTYEVYVHKGIIYKVNDIQEYIYILLKGTVEVLGADYNKLLLLYSGSAFGNLDNVRRSRQTLTMVAKGYVEILKLSSTYFHSVISKYPVIMSHFQQLTIFNVDYIENHDIFLPIMNKNSKSNIGSKSSKKITNRISDESPGIDDFMKKPNRLSFKHIDGEVCEDNKRNTRYSIFLYVFKRYDWIKRTRTTLIFISCFVGFHTEIFQLNIFDNDMVVIYILYFCDLCWWVKIYIDFHMSYIDESGIEVMDISLIVKQYMEKKLGFYLDLASAIPIEIFSLCFINQSYFIIVWTWLRKNRLIRIICFLNLLKENQVKLHVNVKVVRWIFLVSWVTATIQLLTTTLILINGLHGIALEHDHKYLLLHQLYEIIIYATSRTSNIYSVITIIIFLLAYKFFWCVFISEMCSLLETVQQNKTKYRLFALYLKYQMSEEKVAVPLRNQVSEYLNLLWIYNNGVQYPNLLRQAPYYLKEAILNAMYGFHLRRHRLIRHCHTDLIRQMSATFDVLIFFPGNFVVHEGDIDGCMYFIHKGEIVALAEDTLENETIVDTLTTGDCFGLDQGLYKNCGHDCSYKVTKKSTVIALQNDKWFYLLDFFPASKRVLFDMRDFYLRKTDEHLSKIKK